MNSPLRYVMLEDDATVESRYFPYSFFVASCSRILQCTAQVRDNASGERLTRM